MLGLFTRGGVNLDDVVTCRFGAGLLCGSDGCLALLALHHSGGLVFVDLVICRVVIIRVTIVGCVAVVVRVAIVVCNQETGRGMFVRYSE
jgi:hypothetical protein